MLEKSNFFGPLHFKFSKFPPYSGMKPLNNELVNFCTSKKIFFYQSFLSRLAREYENFSGHSAFSLSASIFLTTERKRWIWNFANSSFWENWKITHRKWIAQIMDHFMFSFSYISVCEFQLRAFFRTGHTIFKDFIAMTERFAAIKEVINCIHENFPLVKKSSMTTKQRVHQIQGILQGFFYFLPIINHSCNLIIKPFSLTENCNRFFIFSYYSYFTVELSH